MIEHWLEALQSEAWGVSGEEHVLDFARRVREYLEAQEAQTGDGPLESLPDIVQHICGHAEAIERRRVEQAIPWKTKLADLIREAHEERMKAFERERLMLLLKYPYLGAVVPAYDPSYKTDEEIAEINRVMEKWASESEFAVNDIIRAGNKPEDGAGVPGLPVPITNSPAHYCNCDDEDEAELFGSPGIEEGEPTKTEVIMEECRKRGIPVTVTEIKLSESHPEDLRGLPIVDKKEEKVEWFPPDAVSEEPAIFFDEFFAVDSAKAKAIESILKNQERERGESK